MNAQEPGRDYYEYYCDHEQVQRPAYHDGDYDAENLHRRPRFPASSAPPLTSCALTYGSYTVAGDGMEQTRMPRISRPSEPSAYASYPLHTAHSLATAHPVHRQSTVYDPTAAQQLLTNNTSCPANTWCHRGLSFIRWCLLPPLTRSTSRRCLSPPNTKPGGVPFNNL
jgi:hypothetical protein